MERIQDKQVGKLADMTALNETIQLVQSLNEATYTKTSWNAFSTTYQTALAVQKNIQAAQEEVDTANTELTNAMKGLRTIHAYLEAGIKENYIDPADAQNYTTATWNIYQKYLKEAQELAE